MPELPDVEIFRQRLDGHARRRTISEAHVLDERLLDGVSPKRLSRALEGRRIVATTRHGKYLLVELDDGLRLVLHFGMTGEIVPVGREAEVPPLAALHLVFDDGTALAVTSRRRLGRIALAGEASAFARTHDLGPDALDPVLDARTFQAALGSPRGAIKSALMDQSKLAGIGNIYADEILYQAGLRPNARIGDLSDQQLACLFQIMRRVLHEAVDRGVLAEGMEGSPPTDWLLTHRAKNERCPRCGTAFQTSKVGGRTGYFCPSCQTD